MSEVTGKSGEPQPGESTGPPPQGYYPGPGGWGWPPYPAYPIYRYPKASNATTVLVLGILSVALSWPLGFLGIIAWTLGNTELREIDGGLRPPDGRGIAKAGRICGIVGTCLFGAGCVFGIVWLAAWLLTPLWFMRFVRPG